jgi:hypothetical protein
MDFVFSYLYLLGSLHLNLNSDGVIRRRTTEINQPLLQFGWVAISFHLFPGSGELSVRRANRITVSFWSFDVLGLVLWLQPAPRETGCFSEKPSIEHSARFVR